MFQDFDGIAMFAVPLCSEFPLRTKWAKEQRT